MGLAEELRSTLDYLDAQADAYEKEDVDAASAFGCGMHQAVMHMRIALEEALQAGRNT